MHLTRLKRPILVLMLGTPGAGKSFFARQIAESMHFGYVSGERLRYELFEEPRYDEQENDIILRLMDYMTEVLLNSGTSVIYDDVSLCNYRQRLTRREMAGRAGLESLTVWVQTDPATAYNRASNRDRRKTDEKFSFDMDKPTFERLSKSLEQPQFREQFVVVSGKYLHKNQAAVFSKKLRELGWLEQPDSSTPVVTKPKLPHPQIRPLSTPRRESISRQIRIR